MLTASLCLLLLVLYVGPFPVVQSFRNRVFQHGSPVDHRSCWKPAPAQVFQCHSLLQAFTCSLVGSSVGWRSISAPPWTSLRAAGAELLPHGFYHRLQGDLFSVPGAPPPSPSPPTWVSAEVFLTHILTCLLYLQLLLLNIIFFSILNLSSQRHCQCCPWGFALANSGGSLLELANFGSLRHGGSSWNFSPGEATAAALHYQNLAKQTQSNFLIVTLGTQEMFQFVLWLFLHGNLVIETCPFEQFYKYKVHFPISLKKKSIVFILLSFHTLQIIFCAFRDILPLTRFCLLFLN